MAVLKQMRRGRQRVEDATYTIEGLTQQEVRTVLFALHEARKRYEESLADPDFRSVEDKYFLHSTAGEIAKLHFELFLDHDAETRTRLTEALGTNLDI